MSQVSRPVQVLLAVTALFALVWFVALRPKPDVATESAVAPAQTTPAAPGTEGLKNAVDKAQDAVTTANGDAERAARSDAQATPPAAKGTASTPSQAADAGKTTSRTGGAAPAARKASAAAHSRVHTARIALRQHKALVIAFVDPHTADARATAQEVRHVSHFGGRAVTLVAPLAQLSDYGFITRQVEVTVAPTVVIVNARHRATTIVGFADRGEIEQRLADALPAKHRR